MMKITIIEDDAGILDALHILFERAGMEVVTYRDGNNILKGQFSLPDIFIIDKQLSGVSGIDICRYLKQAEATAAIPVLIISASPGTEQYAILAGADGFVEKPFKNSALLARVRELTPLWFKSCEADLNPE